LLYATTGILGFMVDRRLSLLDQDQGALSQAAAR
jgi:hypothetical protein